MKGAERKEGKSEQIGITRDLKLEKMMMVMKTQKYAECQLGLDAGIVDLHGFESSPSWILNASVVTAAPKFRILQPLLGRH